MQRTNAIRWMFAGIGLAALVFLLTKGQVREVASSAWTTPSFFGVEGRTYRTPGYTVHDTPLDFIPFAYEFFWDGWGYALAAGMFLWGAYRFITAPRDPK